MECDNSIVCKIQIKYERQSNEQRLGLVDRTKTNLVMQAVAAGGDPRVPT